MNERTSDTHNELELQRLLGIVAIVGLIALWFVLTPEVIPELVLPSPESIWETIITLRFELVRHASYTLARVMAGWGAGVTMGIAFGLLMSWSRTVFAISNPIIETVRPLPPIALIPLFIIWFGIGAFSQILLISLGSFMVLVVNTYVSVNNLSPRYIRAASSLGASKLRVYRTVILPAIIPDLVSGFRIASALAFGVGVAAEFIGAQAGVGYMIMVARRTLNTETILLGTIVIGLESYTIDRCIRYVSQYICRWMDKPIEDLS
jgi:ABC-type nitrate/sulfonate/bicarbonate transport system permease component